MDTAQSRKNMREHANVAGLIPWYLNGTLGESERHRVEAHLRSCATCRDELPRERRIYEAMSGESGVEYMPTAALKRLHAKLDQQGPEAVRSGDFRGERRVARSFPRRGALAASIVMAGVLVLWATSHWMPLNGRDMPASYRTVTTPEKRSQEEVIRAVFAPTITLAELQSLLDEAQLKIIAGPTEAGVYSLASKSARPVGVSLALLRGHPSVRFAESTKIGTQAKPEVSDAP